VRQAEEDLGISGGRETGSHRQPLQNPILPAPERSQYLARYLQEGQLLSQRECAGARIPGFLFHLPPLNNSRAATHGSLKSIPENVIEEDKQLQMIHDMAEMRSEG